jgi:hypothetical protein
MTFYMLGILGGGDPDRVRESARHVARHVSGNYRGDACTFYESMLENQALRKNLSIYPFKSNLCRGSKCTHKRVHESTWIIPVSRTWITFKKLWRILLKKYFMYHQLIKITGTPNSSSRNRIGSVSLKRTDLTRNNLSLILPFLLVTDLPYFLPWIVITKLLGSLPGTSTTTPPTYQQMFLPSPKQLF